MSSQRFVGLRTACWMRNAIDGHSICRAGKEFYSTKPALDTEIVRFIRVLYDSTSIDRHQGREKDDSIISILSASDQYPASSN